MSALVLPRPVRSAASVQLIRAEYLEMPGLHLTRDQIRRLWNLDEGTCDTLLQDLIEGEFLRRTPKGAYVRADRGNR